VDHYAPRLAQDARLALLAVIDVHGASVNPQHCPACAAAAAQAHAEADAAADAEADRAAENGWLRVAEAGTPDRWADEDHDRLADVLGYGPPPEFRLR
jgi:hypothetical protein